MTAIPYCDKSWNLTAGCSMVNAGCTHCWAQAMAARMAANALGGYENVVKDGKWTGQVNLRPCNLSKPLYWKKPRRIFVCSMSDIFHERIPKDYIDRTFSMMVATPRHSYLLFTKRYERAVNILANHALLSNIWIVFSVSNQEVADFARPYLNQVASWGWNTGVSYEPALGAVDWGGWEFIKWMVCGGESGSKRRPFDIAWMQDAYLWAQLRDIPFYAKQDSAFKPGQQGRISDFLWGIKEVVPLPKEQNA